jgi:hypothetical protein
MDLYFQLTLPLLEPNPMKAYVVFFLWEVYIFFLIISQALRYIRSENNPKFLFDSNFHSLWQGKKRDLPLPALKR